MLSPDSLASRVRKIVRLSLRSGMIKSLDWKVYRDKILCHGRGLKVFKKWEYSGNSTAEHVSWLNRLWNFPRRNRPFPKGERTEEQSPDDGNQLILAFRFRYERICLRSFKHGLYSRGIMRGKEDYFC